MQSTYDEAIRRLLVHEGGYSNHPNDPGGPTNHGITLADFRKYISAKGTAVDVKNMTMTQAKTIYHEHYANPLRYDDLPAGVDYAVLDYGVNSGISRSAKVLQRVCFETDDGKLGPQTLAAVRTRKSQAVIEAISAERMRFLKGLKTWPTFGTGWTRRVRDVREFSLELAGADVKATYPAPAPGKGHVTKPTSGPVLSITGVTGTAAAFRDWVVAHPFEAAAIGFVVVAGVIYLVNRWHAATFDRRQDAPTPGLVPVPAS